MSHDATLFERYLDGLLSGAELEAAEAMIAASPELRAEVELQRAMDGVVRRWAGDLDSGGARAIPIEPARARWSPAKIGGLVAAVLAIGAFAGWFFLVRAERAPFDQPGETYARVVREGFEPKTVCETDEEFIAWMTDKYDQPMLIPGDAPGLELVGWDYRRVLTTRTGVLLARYQGKQIIVLVEKRGACRRLARDAGEGLHVFRRDVGNVCLYEVTPLDEAVVVPLAEKR